MAVPSEEEYLTKYSAGTFLTMSSYEQHTGLPQRLYLDSLHGVSHITREIYTYVEEDTTSSLYCVGLEGRIHPTFHSLSYPCRTLWVLIAFLP